MRAVALLTVAIAGCATAPSSAPVHLTPDQQECMTWLEKRPEMDLARNDLLDLVRRFYAEERPFKSLIYIEISCRTPHKEAK